MKVIDPIPGNEARHSCPKMAHCMRAGSFKPPRLYVGFPCKDCGATEAGTISYREHMFFTEVELKEQSQRDIPR